MSLKKYHIVCVILLLLVSLNTGDKLNAQQTLVDVSIENPDLMIGEQTVLHLNVTLDAGKQILIPLPAEMITKGVEVLSITPPDTNDIKNNRITIKYDLLITSFDSALYLLPPFIAIDGADTLKSNQVALKVSTLEVNVDKPEEFYDIKEIWIPPFVLSDYYTLIYGILFALFLICVTGYFIQRLRNRKPAEIIKEAIKLPPDVLAINELKQIKEQKLWQQGRNKEYYTGITDTLRKYISSRYDTSVLEKTTSEILDVMREVEKGNKEVYETLRQVLQLSDFVKFAKLHPLPDENDLSMKNAERFVEKTKKIEIVVSEEGKEKSETTEAKNDDEPTLNNQ
jgi:hypothetical protein